MLDPEIVVMSTIFLVNSVPSLNQATFGVGLPVMVTLSLMFSPALTDTPSKYSRPNSMFGATEREY